MIGFATVQGRAAVVGDIHGRADLLAELLRVLPASVPLFVLGDLCDRGPQSREVLDLLIARRATGVRGNHEGWLMQWALRGRFDPFALATAMGGEATLRSYGVQSRVPREIEAARDRVPEAHREWLSELPIALDLEVDGEKYWLLHAGLPLHRSFAGLASDQVVPWLVERHPADVLWPANTPELIPEIDRPVIMGHMPRRRAWDGGHVIAVDTGAGTMANGQLTAVILPERRFLSVG